MKPDLLKIAAKVFGVKPEVVNDDWSREKNSDKWDSFNHLMLISEVEQNLSVKFSIQEVEKIKTFKDLKDCVAGKLKHG